MRDQVLAYFKRWIGILRLGDENKIEVRIIPGKEDLGECTNDPRYGRAYIELRDPSDGTHPDWKESVIHELLHVRIPIAAPEGSALRNIVEHSIEIMSRILCAMDGAGSAPETMYRKAHTWARTIETARVGHIRMKRMNGKRIVEIAVALAAMELPPEAMELVTELSGLAMGDADAAVDNAEMGKDPNVEMDPMLATADAKDPTAAMYRTALGEDGWNQFQKNAQAMARNQIVKMARQAFGDKLTPAQEAELTAMAPRDAAIWIRGRKSAPVTVAPNAMKREELRPAALDNAPILAPGEDAATVHPALLAARASQAAQFGRETVVAALNGKRQV